MRPVRRQGLGVQKCAQPGLCLPHPLDPPFGEIAGNPLPFDPHVLDGDRVPARGRELHRRLVSRTFRRLHLHIAQHGERLRQRVAGQAAGKHFHLPQHGCSHSIAPVPEIDRLQAIGIAQFRAGQQVETVGKPVQVVRGEWLGGVGIAGGVPGGLQHPVTALAHQLGQPGGNGPRPLPQRRVHPLPNLAGDPLQVRLVTSGEKIPDGAEAAFFEPLQHLPDGCRRVSRRHDRLGGGPHLCWRATLRRCGASR